MENTIEQNQEITYLIVDGENIDATLGMSVLDRRPNPEERPRWDRVLEGAKKAWQEPTKGLFFLNGSSGYLPMGFVQALTAMHYSPIPLASDNPEIKVVDVGIQRTLEAIGELGSGSVILASHDGDFVEQIRHLLSQGRKVAMVCFTEFLSSQFQELRDEGLEVFDLERDLGAFQVSLPRLAIISLQQFDPHAFLQHSPVTLPSDPIPALDHSMD